MTTATTNNEERNIEIARLRSEGEASLAEIADQFQISRERVRQISARAGVSNEDAAKAYAARREHVKVDQANEHSPVILMRWIGGEDVSEIAHSLGLAVNATQVVLDEQVTDAVIAARSNNRLASRFPHRDAGPRENGREAREDRHWTDDRCWATLVWLAQQNGGRLMSSTKYMQASKGREDLPSFATVRNRLGRWSSVRTEVHRRVNA